MNSPSTPQTTVGTLVEHWLRHLRVSKHGSTARRSTTETSRRPIVSAGPRAAPAGTAETTRMAARMRPVRRGTPRR